MCLPQYIAFIILTKLSSSKIISLTSFADYVPAIPIEKPTSAFYKEGTSLVPLAVTATV